MFNVIHRWIADWRYRRALIDRAMTDVWIRDARYNRPHCPVCERADCVRPIVRVDNGTWVHVYRVPSYMDRVLR